MLLNNLTAIDNSYHLVFWGDAGKHQSETSKCSAGPMW